jgi:hypothetical protein
MAPRQGHILVTPFSVPNVRITDQPTLKSPIVACDCLSAARIRMRRYDHFAT